MIPFIVCGDTSAYDSDVTYPLQLEGAPPYQHSPPVQGPLGYQQELAKSDFLANLSNLTLQDDPSEGCTPVLVLKTSNKVVFPLGPYLDLLDKVGRAKKGKNELKNVDLKFLTELEFFSHTDPDPDIAQAIFGQAHLGNLSNVPTCFCSDLFDE